jgi:hypothetical protein
MQILGLEIGGSWTRAMPLSLQSTKNAESSLTVSFSHILFIQMREETFKGRCYDHNFWQNLSFFSKTNVMITIFGDFCQFSAKKCRFSQKPILCYLYIFWKTSVSLRKKTNICRHIFGENIFKIITTVPGIRASIGSSKNYFLESEIFLLNTLSL